MTTVLKLGGSVITEKDEPETVDEARLDRLAAAVGAADEPMVLVHGAGSFGHHHAANHGVSVTAGTRDASAAREIHGSMVRLNETVVTALADHGVPALPVPPLAIGARDAAGTLTFPTAAVERQLSEGFVPVLYGDVIAQESEGMTVISGDELVERLAGAVDADRVGVCSSVDGVLDEDDAVIDRIERFEDVAHVLGGSDATDVSGGMAGKVRALLELDVPASVFGPGAIDAFVAGDSPGTTIDGS
jgi:isopentenyl phosphate kinase